MKKKNPTLKETFAKAVLAYKKRDFETAEIICNKILSIDPNHFDSINLLASISALSGNFIEAKKLLTRAIEIKPKNVRLLNNLGTACKHLGELKTAVSYYKKAIDMDSNNASAYYNLGAICYDLKQLDEAKKNLQKSISFQADFALPLFVLGNIYKDLKDYKSAISYYQKSVKINNKLVSAYNNLGLVFRILNNFESAIDSYEKAIKIKPDHTGAHHNLALALKETGKFNEAIKSHEMAIKYEPENLAHYFYLSNLKKNILDSSLKKKIEKVIQNNSLKNNIVYGNFLLAKYEQKEKNYEKELNFLKKGHQYYFDTRKIQFEIMVKYCFEDMLQISNNVEVKKLNKENKDKVKPIFIVGVPRCGSTLVEKILGFGKKFVPMGEETAIMEEFVTAKILKKQSLNLGDAESIRDEISNIYKHRGLISQEHDNTFTDKSLNNFFFLKLIKLIYPNAKIINCRRDVLSSIMSIIQNNLTELAWAHNLENIFKYFDNYFTTIKKYQKIDSNFIYELEFEKLTNNPEEESKKLMKFCELPWDRKCLEFYKRKDLTSKTASNIQIRSAIYKHALEKYLPYKIFLSKYGEKYSWFN